MNCACSYSDGVVTELCVSHMDRIDKAVKKETERCAKIAEEVPTPTLTTSPVIVDVRTGIACKIREPKGSPEIPFEDGNWEKFQEHLDRHDDNASCDKCVLALRHKINDLEKMVNRTFLKVF